MVFLPAASTHFLAPLDATPFAFQRKSSPNILLEAALEAEKETFKCDVIKAGFESTGIFPFDGERISKLLKDHYGSAISPSTTGKKDPILQEFITGLSEVHEEAKQTHGRFVEGRLRVQKEALFLPTDVIQEREKQIQKKINQKVLDKEEKKRKREESKEKKEALASLKREEKELLYAVPAASFAFAPAVKPSQ